MRLNFPQWHNEILITNIYLLICVTTVATACQEEEQNLRNENENLKKEVNDLKNRLIAAEIKNGGLPCSLCFYFVYCIIIYRNDWVTHNLLYAVKQVQLPRGAAVVSAPLALPTEANQKKSADQPQQQKKKEKKQQANKGKTKPVTRNATATPILFQ